MLVLREIAYCMPTFFFQNVQQFFEVKYCNRWINFMLYWYFFYIILLIIELSTSLCIVLVCIFGTSARFVRLYIDIKFGHFFFWLISSIEIMLFQSISQPWLMNISTKLLFILAIQIFFSCKDSLKLKSIVIKENRAIGIWSNTLTHAILLCLLTYCYS